MLIASPFPSTPFGPFEWLPADVLDGSPPDEDSDPDDAVLVWSTTGITSGEGTDLFAPFASNFMTFARTE